MREVKYKAFDKVNGEWLDSDDLIFQGGCWFKNFRALEDYVALPVDEGDVAIVQFTSLKDRNGVEIYEGDIMQFNDKEENKGPVTWHKDCWIVKTPPKYIGDDWGVCLWDALVDEYEVIGNIYEHPHLLEGVK